jgi:ComEC/Rec2-related protein
MLTLQNLSLSHIKQTFISCREKERCNRVLWLPVLVGIGISIYFSTGLKYISLLISTALLSFLFKQARYLSFCLWFIAIGMIAADFKVSRLNHASLEKERYLHRTLAKVENIENFSKYKRLLLSGIKDKNLKYIRLTTRGKLDPDIQPGDIISISAVLKPLPLPAAPSSYDFARFAFFEEIGATGFVAGEIKIVQKGKQLGILKDISRLRQNLSNHFIEIMGQRAGGIAAALLVGKRESIDNDLLAAIRNSGLAHLLAVSGLHITLVSGFAFVMICSLLALSEHIALRFNVRKLAAVISIFCSLAYLMISGAAVSAKRAFLMTCMFFLAMIIDRISISMRSVAFAALIILLFYPESISRPGFQMSFAAVVSLIAFYDFMKARGDRDIIGHPVPLKIQRTMDRDGIKNNTFVSYFRNVVLSSLVATFATSVYSIYHFNHFSVAGIFSNLIAIPLFAFWIMPIGMIAICCIKFTNIFLLLMKYGIDLLIYIAETAAHFPYASLNITEISSLCLCIITIGGLWLCLWRSGLRLFGIPLIIFGIFLGYIHKPPDVLVNEKMAAVRLEDNKLYFLKKARSNFTNRIWLQRNGQKDFRFLNNNDYNDMISCNQDACIYSKDGRRIAFVHSDNWSDCNGFDLVINLNSELACSNSINKKDLSDNGTHAIYISSSGLKLVSTRERHKKIW